MAVSQVFSSVALCCCIFACLLVGSLGFNLTILHTNDVHARFDQTNKYSGQCSDDDAAQGKCFGGMARLHTKVKELRATYPNTVLLDAGDQYQGTIWFFKYGGNITAHFMNLIGYDAMGLGNHEFDEGPDGTKVLLDLANFPILSANTDASSRPDVQSKLRPSVVKEIGGEKVGIIGYTTTDTSDISNPEPITFTDEAQALQREVDKMTRKGVNKIIAVGHAGFSRDLRVAREVTGLDVIVGGHTNTFLYNGEAPSNEDPVGSYPTVITRNDSSKVLVVQDYAFAKYLGFLQVEFDDDGMVTSWSGNPILLDNSTAQDPDALEEIRQWGAGVTQLMNQVVGRTLVFLQGDNPCRIHECNLGNMLTDAMIHQNLRHSDGEEWNHVAIAFLNSGGIRTSVVKGNISVAQIMSVQPFRNTVDILELNGSTILMALEHSASLWSTTDPHGGFLQFSGLHVVYDLSKPVGSRVVEVKVKCADCSIPSFVDLELSKVYKVIMPSFIADGGDGYYLFEKYMIRRHIIGDLDTDIATEYISTFSPIIHGLEGRIRIINATSDTPDVTTPASVDVTTRDFRCRDPVPVGFCIIRCTDAAERLSWATAAMAMTFVSIIFNLF